MKNKIKKNKIILTIVILVFLISNNFKQKAFSYHTKYSHPKITQESITLYNQFYPEQKITKEQAELIMQGSIKEDEMLVRTKNHFYEPVSEKGLSKQFNAKEWANGAGSNDDDSWQRAIAEYQEGDNEEAFEILGRILHLLEDMSVPAHTRLDPHTNDPYERWVEEYLEKNEIDFSLISPVYYDSLDKYFDDIAIYSSSNFISKDTNDLGIEINDELHQSYYEHLVPYVIPRLAGAIKLFFDEAGGAQVEKPLTFFEKVWQGTTTFAIKSWNTTTDIAVKTWDATETAAVKTWNATSDFAVNSWNTTSTFMENSYNSIQSGIQKALQNPQTQQTGLTNILPQDQNNDSPVESEKIVEEVRPSPIVEKKESIYDAQFYAQSEIFKLEPRQGATISVQFRNTGNVIWNKNNISLNIVSADAAKFRYSGWLTNLRPTLQDQLQVQPSKLAGFTFPIQAPAEEGEYDLVFKIVYQDGTGFHNLGTANVRWKIKVEKKEVLVDAPLTPISSPVYSPVPQNIPTPAPIPAPNPPLAPQLPQFIANLNIPLGFTFYPCNGPNNEEIDEIAEEPIEEIVEEEEPILLETPIITTNDGANFLTNVAAVTLEGMKEERIANIYINSSTEDMVYETTTSWAKDFTLSEGENIFAAQGTDGNDNWSAASTISITYDSVAPSVDLSISNNEMFSNSLTLNASSSDEDIYQYVYEYQSSTTTGEWIVYEATANQSIDFTAQNDAAYYFRITAIDEAGNEGFSEISSAEICAHPIVFNEIAWMGTESNGDDEWIELYNKSGQDIFLKDWTIEFDGITGITLKQEYSLGIPSRVMFVRAAMMAPTIHDLIIESNTYYLIERTDDRAIRNMEADWFGSFSHGGLKDAGVKLTLKNNEGIIVDELNCSDDWFAGDKGQGSDTKKSMERVSIYAGTNDFDNWQTNNEMVINGEDNDYDPIIGTPRMQNSVSY